MSEVRIFPCGVCFCGCGAPTNERSYFLPGHDKRAVAQVVTEVYGGAVQFLAAHNYGPAAEQKKAST